MLNFNHINWNILEVTEINSKINNLEINWLYNLSPYYGEGEFDYIYTNILNKTKFYKILLKEWWYYLKVNWTLIIDFKSNKILNFSNLIVILNLFFKNDYKLDYFDLWDNLIRLEIKKERSTINKNDSIEKWTFWIITNWKRKDWIIQVIESIIKQNIPHYEIIICWFLEDKSIIDTFNIKYIEFTEKDNIGWITKKKNLVVENALYENLMIMHDKIILDNNWFKWMKEYWNNFESLSCITHTSDWRRYSDWKIALWKDLYYIHNKVYNKIKFFVNQWIYKESLWFNQFYLDYKDWDEKSVVIGHFNIVKKSIISKVKWDENLYWNCAEDIALSYDLSSNWYLNKFNSYSKVTSLNYRQAEHPIITFNSKKLWKIHSQYILRLLFFIVKIIKITWLDLYLQPLINYLKNTNVYKKLIK